MFGLMIALYPILKSMNIVALSFGIGIFAFMYSFRRQQRILMEKRIQEEFEEKERKLDERAKRYQKEQAESPEKPQS